MKKIRWGVLSTARIGVQKVIPAMQKGKICEIAAISSRDFEKAGKTAEKLNISKAYGSYDELLDDPEIDAIYNPMPNHLHVPWSIKAIEAGKHVLCEKPIALSAEEARQLADAAKARPDLKVMEAFMYRHHPQWREAKALVDRGEIGDLRTIHSHFSYFNDDPNNVRNMPEIGGGGLLDIGCYSISLSRFIFGREPKNVFAKMEFDPRFHTDILASGVLDFGPGTSIFSCSTQLGYHQSAVIFGTTGSIQIEIPFNPPFDKPTRIFVRRGDEIEEKTFPVCNQFTIQGNLFSRAILEDRDVPTPLTDAVANMKVIDAVKRSSIEEKSITITS